MQEPCVIVSCSPASPFYLFSFDIIYKNHVTAFEACQARGDKVIASVQRLSFLPHEALKCNNDMYPASSDKSIYFNYWSLMVLCVLDKEQGRLDEGWRKTNPYMDPNINTFSRCELQQQWLTLKHL